MGVIWGIITNITYVKSIWPILRSLNLIVKKRKRKTEKNKQRGVWGGLLQTIGLVHARFPGSQVPGKQAGNSTFSAAI